MAALDFNGNWWSGAVGNLSSATAKDYVQVGPEAADRLQLVRSPRRRGNYALQVSVQQNDTDHNGTTERTETTSTAFTYAPGDDIWMALSVLLDLDFPAPAIGIGSSPFTLVHQMFGSTGGQTTGSPPIALEVGTNGQWQLTVRGGVKASPGASAPKSASYNIMGIQRGKWADFLIHARLAKDGTGLTECYGRHAGGTFPGSPQVSDSGMNVLTVAGVDQNVYPETGYYRGTMPATGKLYNGGVFIRKSRAHAEAYFSDPTDYHVEVLTDTPTAYYKMNESSGGVVDASGNNHTGTYVGSPTLQSAGGIVSKTDKAVNFSPANSCATVSPLIAGLTNITLEVIFKLPAGGSGIQTIYAESNSAQQNASYLWFYLNSGRPGFQLRDDAGVTASASTTSTSTPFVDGNWHHLVVVATKNGNVLWYYDGRLDSTTGITGLGTITCDVADIGRLRRVTPGSYAANVTLQDLALYTKVLSPDRIQAHADAVIRDSTTTIAAGYTEKSFQKSHIGLRMVA